MILAGGKVTPCWLNFQRREYPRTLHLYRWKGFISLTGYLYYAYKELRTLSRSLSDCQSLTLNVMIRVSQFVRNSQQLCHYVTKSLNRSQRLRLRLRRFICLCLLVFLINCQKSHMCLRQ